MGQLNCGDFVHFSSAVTRAVGKANWQIRTRSASAGLDLPVYTSAAIDNSHVLHPVLHPPPLKGVLRLESEMVEEPLAEVSLLASGPAEIG